MSELNFIYWLQGFLELTDSKIINENQIQAIKDHIKLVLKKETPTITIRPGSFPYNATPTPLGPLVPQQPLTSPTIMPGSDFIC